MTHARNLTLLGLSLMLARPTTGAYDPPPLAEYFRIETEKLASRPLQGIENAEQWKAKRPELQRQLREMLGLDPEPPRTPLKVEHKGTIELSEFVVEKLLFQSAPGLYVTANLYRPKKVEKPLPAILYVCGHAKVEKNGEILGCKAHYQHHAAWYASNGYVCLVVDTLQLGELPGFHHGTYRYGMWWWQSRGYTPAGIEAWNGVRSIDYLISRPDVDKSKIGVTGRSGGGATSWYVGAIDDRVTAVIPVAGITDLRNHVVDSVIEGHCDCMYFVNTYRWDYHTLAALVAPKAMLVENTDKDPIFPEDGVRRIYRQVERVYEWHGATDRLGLVVGGGGHVDSTEVRHPSFAFMNKWLKGEETPVEEPARPIDRERLKVLAHDEIPADNRNSTLHESFIALPKTPAIPESAAAWNELRASLLAAIDKKVFGGLPTDAEAGPLDVKQALDVSTQGIRLRAYEYTSQPGVRLRAWLLTSDKGNGTARVLVLDQTAWNNTWGRVVSGLDRSASPPPNDLDATWLRAREEILARGPLVLIAPRGVGPTAWTEKQDVHVRRRHALLGQTLDGMRVWDVSRAVSALSSRSEAGDLSAATFAAEGNASAVLLWASVRDGRIASIDLTRLPTSAREGPAFLNLSRIVEMPRALALSKAPKIRLATGSPTAWHWAAEIRERFETSKSLEIRHLH